MGSKIVPLPTEVSDSIRQITARMEARDEAAFTEFYDRYCDRLYRYLLLLTRGNESHSRDLLQTTMTKVMQGIRAFADDAHLWNWLTAVARNNFIDALRRTKCAPQIVPLLTDDMQDMAASAPGGEETPLFEALDYCLTGLEPEERALVDAFYFKDGSYQSVAEQQDTTAKAVESKLARVRQKLRAALLRQLRYENQ